MFSSKPMDSGALAEQQTYESTRSLSKMMLSDLLWRMIDNARNYGGWSLSGQDSADLVKLIQHRKRDLCGSFCYQLDKYFDDFRDSTSSASTDKKLNETADSAETEALVFINNRYREVFKHFDLTILKRLQTSLRRSRASVAENPLQVNRLCESFQSAIGQLELEVDQKIALFQLFTDYFIESLNAFYRHIDQHLLSQGMQRDLPLAKIQRRKSDGEREPVLFDAFDAEEQVFKFKLLEFFEEQIQPTSSHYQNLLPEVKIQFANLGLRNFDDQIEQLSKVFLVILEDYDLPSSVKQQIARLQVHAVITAIHEPGFMQQASHPVRKILDSIIKNEIMIDTGGHPEFSGIRFIREQMDTLTSRQYLPSAIYTEVLGGYQGFIKDNEAAARKSQKAAVSKRLMPLIKSTIVSLTQPLKDQGTPLILFEKVWLPLMLQIALQKGMDSEPWHRTTKMIKKQVWSMIPKNSRQEHAELVKALPEVSHSMHRAMRSLRLAETLQLSLRDYFNLEQQNVVDRTLANIEQSERRSPPPAAASYETMQDSSEFDSMMKTGVFMVTDKMMEQLDSVKFAKPKKVNMVDSLVKGEWVNILQGGQKILAKLAWKADDGNLFIFVDRDGKRVCEVDAETLLRRFDSGDVALIGNETVDYEKNRVSFMTELR